MKLNLKRDCEGTWTQIHYFRYGFSDKFVNIVKADFPGTGNSYFSYDIYVNYVYKLKLVISLSKYCLISVNLAGMMDSLF